MTVASETEKIRLMLRYRFIFEPLGNLDSFIFFINTKFKQKLLATDAQRRSTKKRAGKSLFQIKLVMWKAYPENPK